MGKMPKISMLMAFAALVAVFCDDLTTKVFQDFYADMVIKPYVHSMSLLAHNVLKPLVNYSSLTSREDCDQIISDLVPRFARLAYFLHDINTSSTKFFKRLDNSTQENFAIKSALNEELKKINISLTTKLNDLMFDKEFFHNTSNDLAKEKTKVDLEEKNIEEFTQQLDKVEKCVTNNNDIFAKAINKIFCETLIPGGVNNARKNLREAKYQLKVSSDKVSKLSEIKDNLEKNIKALESEKDSLQARSQNLLLEIKRRSTNFDHMNSINENIKLFSIHLSSMISKSNFLRIMVKNVITAVGPLRDLSKNLVIYANTTNEMSNEVKNYTTEIEQYSQILHSSFQRRPCLDVDIAEVYNKSLSELWKVENHSVISKSGFLIQFFVLSVSSYT